MQVDELEPRALEASPIEHRCIRPGVVDPVLLGRIEEVPHVEVSLTITQLREQVELAHHYCVRVLGEPVGELREGLLRRKLGSRRAICRRLLARLRSCPDARALHDCLPRALAALRDLLGHAHVLACG